MTTINTFFEPQSKAYYKNAQILKVYEDDIYDIKFSTGKIEMLIENVSNGSFSSGDYVSVIMFDNIIGKTYKIIGKGKKFISPDSIPTVRV